MTDPTIHEETPPVERSGSAGDGNLAVPMRLRDFLEGVATIYDLPGRRRRAKQAADSRGKPERKPIPVGRRNALVAAAAVTSVLWAVATIKRAPAEFGGLPQAMYGGWHTKDARYSDRAFWIKGNQIAFQTGSDSLEVTIHKITQVQERVIGGDTLQYTLQYTDEGGPVTWAVQFIQRPKPEIRFLNQRNLAWTPTPNSVWPAP